MYAVEVNTRGYLNSRHNGRCYDIDEKVIGVPSLAGEDSGERGATDQGLVLVPRLCGCSTFAQLHFIIFFTPRSSVKWSLSVSCLTWHSPTTL